MQLPATMTVQRSSGKIWADKHHRLPIPAGGFCRELTEGEGNVDGFSGKFSRRLITTLTIETKLRIVYLGEMPQNYVNKCKG